MAAKRKIEAPEVDDLANVEFETSEDVEVVSSFDKMGLNAELLRGIYSYGSFLDKQMFYYIIYVFLMFRL